MTNVLTFTSLYPSAAQPVAGVFVENRLRRLAETKQVMLTVVAPTLWLPLKSRGFGRYAFYARVPRHEQRHGIEIFRPRYCIIPMSIGRATQPMLLYRAVRGIVSRLVRERQIDLIDAHFFFPNGVAAVRLAQDLGLPVCVTARGSDLNFLLRFSGCRRQIEWAAREANALITVCDALQQPLLSMGIEPSKITTLRNGVDLDLFRPLDRERARCRWAAHGRTIVSVGVLKELKGHHLAIEAMKSLRDSTLLIAGGGEEHGRLERQIADAGLSGRVRLLGEVAHEDLPSLYNAADSLILASSREGLANVLLEAMACGTPVVATDVGGNAEAVTAPEAGVLISERSSAAIAEALRQLFARVPDRAATRAYAERFSWDMTTEGQLALFRGLTGRR
jgi:teichuronic acid biosynthesis glycosyltransferase TuaC